MQISPQLQITVGGDAPQPANWKALLRAWTLLAQVVNGLIGFGNPGQQGAQNIDGVWASVTAPGTPDTDFTITHNLNRAAVGYWLMAKDRACDVYTSPTANADPTHKLILRATVASAVLEVFIV